VHRGERVRERLRSLRYVALRTRRERLLELLDALRVRDRERVKVSAASNLELVSALGLLDADRC